MEAMVSACPSEVFCGSTTLTPAATIRSSALNTTAPNGPPVPASRLRRDSSTASALLLVGGAGARGIDGVMHPCRQGEVDLCVKHQSFAFGCGESDCCGMRASAGSQRPALHEQL